MLNRGSTPGSALVAFCLLVSLPGVAVEPARAQNAAPAAAAVKLGIVSFLTGPAAAPFGIPGRNGAEIMIESMNAGKVPAPFNKVGFGGSKIEARYIDETGSAANVVTEFRNLVQRDQVDAVVGYVSSGSCLAVTPVAEELKALTVLYDCGTPRIFEEKPRSYVFRVSPHATMDSVGAARYLLARKPDTTSYSGINQNYAWGQDSWRDFAGAMQVLAPKITVDKVLFPKLFAGEYGAEISTLLTSKSQVLHTSFYDGDLEAFLYQEQARALDKRMTIIATTGEAAIWRLRDKMPNGTIIGGRGPNGPLAPDSELNRWFQKIYSDRYNVPPTYPAYQMAMSLLGQADDRRGGGGVQGYRVRRPFGQGQARHQRWAPGHLGNRLWHLSFQQGEERTRNRRYHALPGRVREPAGRRQCRRLDQARHERREVLNNIRPVRGPAASAPAPSGCPVGMFRC
jgi:branched-chain amino acid transport system substrate-binding protein